MKEPDCLLMVCRCKRPAVNWSRMTRVAAMVNKLVSAVAALASGLTLWPTARGLHSSSSLLNLSRH